MTEQQRRLLVSGRAHNRISKEKTRRMRPSLRVSRSVLHCSRNSKPNKHSAEQVVEKRRRRNLLQERRPSQLLRTIMRSSNVYVVQVTSAKVWMYLAIVQLYLLPKDTLKSQLLLYRRHRCTRLLVAVKKPINLQLARLPKMMLAPLDRMIVMPNRLLLAEPLQRPKHRQTLVTNKTQPRTPKRTKKMRIQWTKRPADVKS
jgi:hypothetical protein